MTSKEFISYLLLLKKERESLTYQLAIRGVILKK